MDLTAGNYSVTATDGLTSAELSLYVSEPAPLVVDVVTTNSTSTNNGSATAAVTGGTPVYSYQWSNGNVDATINDLAAGDYTLILILNLILYAKEVMDVNITITDLVGREIFSDYLNLDNSKYVFPIDVESFESGIYNLKIKGKRTRIVEQFSIHR